MNSVHDAATRYLKELMVREDAMVTLLKDLVERDTPSNRKDLVDDAMSVVEACLLERGAKVERVGNDTAGDHLIGRWRRNDADERRRVLVLAHLDTVWPPGETTRRPFVLDDGVITGPGVFDMKGGLVQALFAIDVFLRNSTAPHCDITMLVTSDEESGSITSRALIERLAREVDVVFVAEPASGTKLKTSRKGVGMYTVHVEGVASHAGLEPERGRSAVLELAHQVIKLHSFNDPVQGSTVTVGVVEGGSARNVVPASASATVDLRVVTAAAADLLDAQIRSLKPVLAGTTVRVDGGINRPPMEHTDATEQLSLRAHEIAEVLGEDLGQTAVGGGSDGNFTSAIGVPTLDGLGSVGGGAHSLDEHVLQAKLPIRAALLAALLHDIADRGVPSG